MVAGVLVDANVLFSRTLRDWLFLLRNQAGGDLFTVYATEDIVAETVYRLRRRHPTAPGRVISHVHDLITEQLDLRVSDFTIDTTHPSPDPDDAHVHAAAVASEASILLTADTGFTRLPHHTLDSLPYEVRTPDAFFVLIDDTDPASVRQVTVQQLDCWFQRDDEADLAGSLRKAGCPLFARRVAGHVHRLRWTPPV
ncbi:MAG: PIN domain-containing protein [Aeromicrobium sp.]|uniref:PIN domain-containing protein n=1 Tax=Aeromicrobium sp. TaxID=1871063 RepID=UPI0039E71146